MLKAYFPTEAGAPAPLRVHVERKVRFEEVDALGIVWHGQYASYFEDARATLGDQYGIGYMDFHQNGVRAPVKIFHVDYHHPLRLREAVVIEGILHWSEAARINYEFIIRDSKGEVATTGYTVQVMLDMEDNLFMVPPPFYMEFCKRWKAGELK
jgi:acyl-CoA thioester hydrolase